MKTVMTDELYRYLLRHSPLPHPILEKVRRETALRSDATMQISADQGAFMHHLVRLTRARRVVEVGCFTGYSAIALASALEPGGRLFSLDLNSQTAAIARSYFEEAELADRIELRLGQATEGLGRLIDEFGRGSFDLAFIDADKSNYSRYYESCLELVRTGGLILVDNVLWGGRVIDAADQSEDTVAIRALNAQVSSDVRVEKMMLPIADGLLWCMKK